MFSSLSGWLSPLSAVTPTIVTTSIAPASKIDIDGLLDRLEKKDPNILHLRNVGDGYIKLESDAGFEGVKAEPVTNLLGTQYIMPVFPHEILIASSWDKNAVFYNLDKSRFPNLRTIILFCHPCEYSVPWRYKEATWISLYSYRRYFEGHPGYVEPSQEQIERLHAALNAIPYYTTRHGSGDHSLILCRPS